MSYHHSLSTYPSDRMANSLRLPVPLEAPENGRPPTEVEFPSFLSQARHLNGDNRILEAGFDSLLAAWSRWADTNYVKTSDFPLRVRKSIQLSLQTNLTIDSRLDALETIGTGLRCKLASYDTLIQTTSLYWSSSQCPRMRQSRSWRASWDPRFLSNPMALYHLAS